MYRPLPPCVTIGASKIDGLGLIATQDLPAHFELGIGHVKDGRFENGWIRTPLGGFINHSSEPNCVIKEVDDFLMIFTDSEIREGDELTLYYTLYIPS
jgi:hypothetical protein